MNFYDNLWKITILLLLLYIIYIIYEVQIEIKEKLLPEKINKNIVYKTFNDNDNDNENLREEILDFEYENENENEHDLQSISDISIQSMNSEDLKTKNVKELKSFAKSLNINTSKKKKDDIITDILFYCNK